MRDPEDPSQTYRTSYPVTALDDPHQSMPVDIKAAIREGLRENFPALADRPLARTQICWYVVCTSPIILAFKPRVLTRRKFEQTTTSDFLICPRPRFSPRHRPFPAQLEIPPSIWRGCHRIYDRHATSARTEVGSKKGDIGPY